MSDSETTDPAEAARIRGEMIEAEEWGILDEMNNAIEETVEAVDDAIYGESDPTLISDFARMAEKNAQFSAKEVAAGNKLVETPDADSYKSFDELVEGYGEHAEDVAEHLEDGDKIIVLTDFTETETDQAVDFYAQEIRDVAAKVADGTYVTTTPEGQEGSFDGTVSAYAEQIEDVAEAYEDGRQVTYQNDYEDVDFEDHSNMEILE